MDGEVRFELTERGRQEITAAPTCPLCGGPMWDLSLTKRTPAGADYGCRDRRCDGAVNSAERGVAER